jgi:hypothetical protein
MLGFGKAGGCLEKSDTRVKSAEALERLGHRIVAGLDQLLVGLIGAGDVDEVHHLAERRSVGRFEVALKDVRDAPPAARSARR